MEIWQWIGRDVGLVLLRVRYLPFFNKILDLMPEPDALISVMPLGLVKFTVGIVIEVTWQRVWKWTRIQRLEKTS